MTKQAASSSAKNAAVFNQESTVKSWDSDYYHPIAVQYYDNAIPGMLTEMGAKPGDRILDAGCGPGVHSIRAAAFGCDVTAMDLSSTMLSHARERAEAAAVADRIDFRQGDLTAPDIDETFKFVFSWGVIIHIPDTEKALDGLASLVAKDGKLALQILNADALDYRLETVFRKLLRKPFKKKVDTNLGPGNWYTLDAKQLWVLRFDMTALDKAMEARGFKLVARQTAEFSELQRRLPEILRKPLLHLNTFMYNRRWLTNLAATQIVYYQKTKLLESDT